LRLQRKYGICRLKDHSLLISLRFFSELNEKLNSSRAHIRKVELGFALP